MIFFTSDTHFKHQRILDYCGESRQGFASSSEMDEAIIKRWNGRVKPDDIVYHLGDFAFGDVQFWIQTICRLNGQIYLIPGNHDQRILNKSKDRFLLENETNGRLTIKSSYLEEKFKDPESTLDGDQKTDTVILSHYPILSWNKKYYGSIHLHGHSHATLAYDLYALDVGIDARPQNDLAPWSWAEIKSYLAERKESGKFLTRNISLMKMHKKAMV